MDGQGPTLLLVDDECHILHVLSARLRGSGYRVLTANNGAEGLEVARAQQPAMLVVDNQMPVMSGLELAQALYADAQTAGIPVLMVSGRGFSIAEEELARTNIAAVLGKPFSPREVERKVGEILSPCAGRLRQAM